VKILLLNDNPVVTKLVNLSAQKTDDTVTTAHRVEEAAEGSYDLLVIDDAQYSEESYAELKKKIKFKKSLFICSRDNRNEESFSATIKKPFLPTDMVELFTTLKKNLDVVEDEADEELLDGLELEGLDDLDELDDIDNIDNMNELEDMDDELILDDAELTENVLDDEEAQKVKELLDETQDEDFNLDYDISLDLEDEADEAIAADSSITLHQDVEDVTNLDDFDMNDISEDIDLEDEVDLDIASLDLEDDVLAEDEEMTENDELPEDVVEAEEFEENLQTQIEDAVEELSQEDLESEVDEDTLLEIANNEIDSFATLNSKDLKVALGEADASDEEDELAVEEVDELEDMGVEREEPVVKESENKGLASLKRLLTALENEDVAAAMKGAKITINISFED